MKTLENYLKRTQNHLFKIGNTDNLFKLVLFTKDNIDYFATITFKKDGKFGISVREVKKYNRVSIKGKEYIDPYLKRSILFQKHYSKKTCVKHFKSIIEKIEIIKDVLENHYAPCNKGYWNNHCVSDSVISKIETSIKSVR